MAGRRLAAFIVVTSAVVAGLFAPATAQSARVVGETGQLLAALNTTRTSEGLPALRADPRLAAVATVWAEHMASNARLSHSRLDRRVEVRWSVLGENVGRGPGPEPIHSGLLASPAHRRNILDPRFDRVGIGIARRGAVLYVAQVFLASPTRDTPAQEAPPIRSAGGSR